MVNSEKRFQGRLKQDVPRAVVSSIYRNRDSNRIYFAENVDVKVDYWLVAVGDQAYILPKPLSDRQFSEIMGGVMKGPHNIQPSGVQRAIPAHVRSDGAEYVIEETGSIS